MSAQTMANFHEGRFKKSIHRGRQLMSRKNKYKNRASGRRAINQVSKLVRLPAESVKLGDEVILCVGATNTKPLALEHAMILVDNASKGASVISGRMPRTVESTKIAPNWLTPENPEKLKPNDKTPSLAEKKTSEDSKDSEILDFISKKYALSISAVAERIGRSMSALYDVMKGRRVLTKNERIALASLFSISPELVGLNPIEYYEFQQPKRKMISFTQAGRFNYSYRNFLEDYFNLIIESVRSARFRITILSYCETNFQNELEIQGAEVRKNYLNFHYHYKRFLSAINETVVSNDNLQYEMLFQLPVNETNERNSDSYYDAFVDSLMSSLYTSDFAHLHLINLQNRDSAKVKVLENPIRKFGLIIVDERIVLTMYSFSNFYNEAIPDILFRNDIEKHHQTTKDLIQVHNEAIKQEAYRARNITSRKLLEKMKRRQNELIQIKNNVQEKIQTMAEDSIGGRNNLFKELDLIDNKIRLANQKIQILGSSLEDVNGYFKTTRHS